MLGANPETILDNALEGLAQGQECCALFDQLAVPIYTTDAEGLVTYWNRACIEFAGREPELGSDRWCVTWQLYTMTGERLPHDQCPMADAVKQRKAVRDVIAIAARPAGSRRAFRPYPTPLFASDGSFTGAINMLVDVTAEQSVHLQDQADRCRRLAGALYSRESNIVLQRMAENFERTAGELKADNDA